MASIVVLIGIELIQCNIAVTMSLNILVRLIPNQSNNHAVEIEEEHDKVEAELDERFLVETQFSTKPARPDVACAYLLMHIQLAEDFSRIEQMLAVKDPAKSDWLVPALAVMCGSLWIYALLRIVGSKRQIEYYRQPVSID